MCYTPYYIENPKKSATERTIPVPCGKCSHCLKRKASEWQFRMMEEDKVQYNSYFVTLTYNTDNIPITNNGFMTLDKDHITKWLKRLRIYHTRKYGKEHRLKYFVCGEYGDQHQRPHYHAILFNIDIECFTRSWQFGNVDVGTVSQGSITYVTKYMCKLGKIPQHNRDDRVPEFRRMSKGLGKSYVENADIIDYHKNDLNRNFVMLPDGIKIAMPRYMREKIYNEDERNTQSIKIRKLKEKEEKKRYKSFVQKYGDDIDLYSFRQEERRKNNLKITQNRRKDV